MSTAARPAVQKMCNYRGNESQLYRFNVSYINFLFAEVKQFVKDWRDLLERGGSVAEFMKMTIIWLLYNGTLAVGVFFTPIVTAASAYASVIKQTSQDDSVTNTTNSNIQILWHTNHGECISSDSSLYHQATSGMVLNIWMVGVFGVLTTVLIFASILVGHKVKKSSMFPPQLHDLLLVSPVTGYRDAAPRFGTKSALFVENIDGGPFITVDQKIVVAVDRDQARTLCDFMTCIADSNWSDQLISEKLLAIYKAGGEYQW
ncbi:hypothetical protein K450DRAFT_242225 [Umbelopsis ramanniana AG]|uniref:Uncharacterized protein n=1 Tax=Umbelopsis ramanniana AG TaxID=1314678 RepID=A0AAD5HEC7_UMBRA|nr:uncharacterized protein K450DRAFT_242225 [Umbelopsis ramanniana AG]KAI8579451.1 hypothetical protein K450DRAFT_242225 [Umbelopsis ramanniana AG]